MRRETAKGWRRGEKDPREEEEMERGKRANTSCTEEDGRPWRPQQFFQMSLDSPFLPVSALCRFQLSRAETKWGTKEKEEEEDKNHSRRKKERRKRRRRRGRKKNAA